MGIFGKNDYVSSGEWAGRKHTHVLVGDLFNITFFLLNLVEEVVVTSTKYMTEMMAAVTMVIRNTLRLLMPRPESKDRSGSLTTREDPERYTLHSASASRTH